MRPIDVIRAKYPSPMTLKDRRGTDCYCVGGALCRTYGTNRALFPDAPFPTEEHLTRVLRIANPQLTKAQAYSYAYQIISNNDEGHFDKAWDAANEALIYTR